MKKSFLLAIILLLTGVAYASAWDLRDTLGKIGGSSDIGGFVNGILSPGKIKVSEITGNWVYAAPAVTFKSDNLLQKAGGAAAASAIVKKLEPIYATAGIENMTLIINPDATFEMKVKSIPLKGTITENADEGSATNFEFNFKASKLKIGKIAAYVEKTSKGEIKIMFDVSKLIALVNAISSVTGNSTIGTVANALSSYDGLFAGFQLSVAANQ